MGEMGAVGENKMPAGKSVTAISHMIPIAHAEKKANAESGTIELALGGGGGWGGAWGGGG